MTGSERTTVHLLRHGEVHNPRGVLYGRLPGFRLSDAGEEMAQRAARWFEGHDITHLVVSPLERARQTMEPLERLTGLTAVVDDRVIESTNKFEGSTVEFGPEALRKPSMWRYIYNPFRPSWGEPYKQVAKRMLDAADSARAVAAGHEAVIVSHQLPIWIARRAAEGAALWHRPDRRQCALASVTSLHYVGAELVAVSYAEPCGPTVKKPGTVGA